jgi:hypothetical protein
MFSYVQGMSSQPAELLTSSITDYQNLLAALHTSCNPDIALATRSLGRRNIHSILINYGALLNAAKAAGQSQE